MTRVGRPIRATALRERADGDRRIMMDAIGLAIAELLPPDTGVPMRTTCPISAPRGACCASSLIQGGHEPQVRLNVPTTGS